MTSNIVIHKGGGGDAKTWLLRILARMHELTCQNLEDCRDVLFTEEIDRLRRMLFKYADIFSNNDADIGKTCLV